MICYWDAEVVTVTEAVPPRINPNQIKAEKSGEERWSVC